MVLLVSTPTRPYQILCSRCETHWWFWIGPGYITGPYHARHVQAHVPPVCFGWSGPHYLSLPRPRSGSEPATRRHYQPPPPAWGTDIHSTVDTEHSRVDTAVDEYSRVEHSGTAGAGPTAQTKHTRVVAYMRQGTQHSTQHSHTVHTVKSGTNRIVVHTGLVMVLELEKFPTRPACVF